MLYNANPSYLPGLGDKVRSLLSDTRFSTCSLTYVAPYFVVRFFSNFNYISAVLDQNPCAPLTITEVSPW